MGQHESADVSHARNGLSSSSFMSFQLESESPLSSCKLPCIFYIEIHVVEDEPSLLNLCSSANDCLDQIGRINSLEIANLSPPTKLLSRFKITELLAGEAADSSGSGGADAVPAVDKPPAQDRETNLKVTFVVLGIVCN
jgi:hypothetical protein